MARATKTIPIRVQYAMAFNKTYVIILNGVLLIIGRKPDENGCQRMATGFGIITQNKHSWRFMKTGNYPANARL